MKNKEALDRIQKGEFSTLTFRDIRTIKEDVDLAFHVLRHWQENQQLGEVCFAYPDTDKTFTLSIAFRKYEKTIVDMTDGYVNGININNLNSYEEADYGLSANVLFGYVFEETEDACDTYSASFALPLTNEEQFETLRELTKDDIQLHFEGEIKW